MPPFEALYEAYFDEVYRYAFSLCGHKETAEDVTAETFLKAMQHMETFRGDCDFKVWLFSIAKNTFYSFCRTQKRFADDPLDEALPSRQNTEDAVIAAAQAEEILKALRTLPEPYREVFSMRVFGELSFRQIGTLFGKTEHWACVTFHRARQKLKSIVE